MTGSLLAKDAAEEDERRARIKMWEAITELLREGLKLLREEMAKKKD
jgi:hypothetical protein